MAHTVLVGDWRGHTAVGSSFSLPFVSDASGGGGFWASSITNCWFVSSGDGGRGGNVRLCRHDRERKNSVLQTDLGHDTSHTHTHTTQPVFG